MTYSAKTSYHKGVSEKEYAKDRYNNFYGQYIYQKEIKNVKKILDKIKPNSIILDVPCGNGRWWKILIKHALPNSLIPVLTVIGTDFGSYLSGAVLTESIFGWPGLGRLTLEAILKRDLPIIQGTVLFMALMFICVNLVIDILYGIIDPRIRAERSN